MKRKLWFKELPLKIHYARSNIKTRAKKEPNYEWRMPRLVGVNNERLNLIELSFIMETAFFCWWKLVNSLALCLHNMLTSVTFNIKAFYFAQMPSCYIFDRMWKKNSIKNILSLRLYLNMMKRYACNCFSNELSFIIFCFHLMQCYRQANIWFTIWLNVQRSQLKCKKTITYVMLKALLLTNITEMISNAAFRIVFDRKGLKGIFCETFGN